MEGNEEGIWQCSVWRKKRKWRGRKKEEKKYIKMGSAGSGHGVWVLWGGRRMGK